MPVENSVIPDQYVEALTPSTEVLNFNTVDPNDVEEWARAYVIAWQSGYNQIDHGKDIPSRNTSTASNWPEDPHSARQGWGFHYQNKAIHRFNPNPGDLTTLQEGFRVLHTRRVLEKYQYFNTIFKYAKSGDKIAEFGIGAGSVLIELAKQGHDITGVDNDKRLLSWIPKNAKTMGVGSEGHGGKITLVEGDLEEDDLEFSEGEFDLIVSEGVLEHFDPEDIPRAVGALLKYGKKVVLAVPIESAASTQERKKLPSVTLAEERGNRVYGNENYLTRDFWERSITDAGGRIIERGGFWTPELGSTFSTYTNPTESYQKSMIVYYVFERVEAQDSVTSIV